MDVSDLTITMDLMCKNCHRKDEELNQPCPTPKAECYDCEAPYGHVGWIEAVIPNDVWQKISPYGDEGGILCITCMAKRLEKLGLKDIPVKLTAGPLVGQDNE